MIAVGVDTHKHEHLARALDGLGQILGGLTIRANPHGYVELAQWLRTLGEGVVVGIEGAGSYGAGLCEYLLAEGIDVVEVERPRRQRCWGFLRRPRRAIPLRSPPFGVLECLARKEPSESTHRKTPPERGFSLAGR